ncbi:MAG: glycosyltransferase family 2 protein [Clostridiaceae bacterium]
MSYLMNQKKSFKISHENKKSISLKDEDKVSFKFICHSFYIKTLNILFDKEKSDGKILVKIKKSNSEEILEKKEISIYASDKNQCVNVELKPILNIRNEELEVEISYKGKEKITLGNKENTVLEFLYDDIDTEILTEIENTFSNLENIYKSEGWKLLLFIYKVRDLAHVLKIKLKRLFRVPIKLIRLINIENYHKFKRHIDKYGYKATFKKILQKFSRKRFSYKYWIKKNSLTKQEIQEQRLHQFEYNPKVSIIVPTYNTPRNYLVEMLESVVDQTYYNWELCIADGNSTEPHVKEVLDQYSEKYSNVVVRYLDENKGIAENTNAAIELANGDFIALLDHDDLLPVNALYEVVDTINKNEDVDFVYSDEDKIDENSKERFDPHFKPDYSPDTLRSYNYICHFSVIKKDLLDKVGGFREGFNGSQDYDLFLRITEQAKNIVHIPKILYHWRVHRNSTAGNAASKLYAFESGVKAIQEHLGRVNLKGKVQQGDALGLYKIKYDLIDNPKISIIIPNKDHIDDLDRCLASIENNTTYENYEVIVVENNSTKESTFEYYEQIKKNPKIKVVYWKKEFNYSAINNFAVAQSDGEYILLLNNDVKVINNDWLENMLQYAQRNDVGAVGAKLYFPDDTVQHGGVILGIGGVAGHSHKNYFRDEYGYFSRLKIVQNLTAVTAACVMIRRDVYNEVNGLDEAFKVAFNDVDLCMKIRDKGYLVVWTPYTELYHYESKSRGSEDTPEKVKRFNSEIDRFTKKWKDELDKGDPYYNKNLSLHNEDFSLKIL